MQLIIAEKPSVARDLARVLGVPARGRTCFEGQEQVITWCVGHLVELEEPAAYDARWKAWRMDTLPMVPTRFELRPVGQTAAQFRAVRDLLRQRRFTEAVNACDAGREGELIFRYVYQLAGARLPVRRLWISSLTDEAIRRGFAVLRPGEQLSALADAARCRSEADWLVGMNATRALTLRRREGGEDTLYSIGRVQTPTLAILVRRELEIRRFVPRDYWEVRGRFATSSGEAFSGTFRYGRASRFSLEAAADEVASRAGAHGSAADPLGPIVERLRKKTQREPPPLLFDLTSLQRTANRRFGMSAAQTLEAAQALYETHKVLTYPRTDSRHLTSDVAPELPKLFRALSALPDYAPFAGELLERPPRPTRRVFDDARVQDHHAIIPTGKPVQLGRLSPDERRIFDLVARRFLGAFFPDAEFALTEVWVRVGPAAATRLPDHPIEEAAGEEPMLEGVPPPPDRFHARGRVRLQAGWQAVAGFGDEAGGGEGTREGREGDDEATQALPPLVEGQRLEGGFETLRKRTRPPARYTEAGLLAAMESAGRRIEDEALREAMKECGLGTPATRAATIETLLKRGFVVRERKSLVPTETGIGLVEALPVESLASPELTGQWEARLSRIARGQERREAFMAEIERYVRDVVEAIRRCPLPARLRRVIVPVLGPPVAELYGLHSSGMDGHANAAVRDERSGAGVGSEGAPARQEAGRSGRARGKSGRRSAPFGRNPVTSPGRSGDAGPRPSASTRAIGSRPARRLATPGGPRIGSGGGKGRGARRTGSEGGGTHRGARAAPDPRTFDVSGLVCPRCRQGALITGKRGWGCSRWREGCGFVLWFEMAGRRLSQAQLRELLTRGKTRKGRFKLGDAWAEGRLVLDLAATDGAARFIADE